MEAKFYHLHPIYLVLLGIYTDLCTSSDGGIYYVGVSLALTMLHLVGALLFDIKTD